MKRLLIALAIFAMLLTACGSRAPTVIPEPEPQQQPLSEPANQDSESGYEVGIVRLIVDDTEHEPGIHFLHGAVSTENGLMSGSGIPFESWLESNLDDLPVIGYSTDIQIVVDGENGQIVTSTQRETEYGDRLRKVGLLAENFAAGVSDISLPGEDEAYLVYVDVRWSGDGDEFTLNRYVFKVIRPIPEPQPQPTPVPALPAQQSVTPAAPPEVGSVTPLAPPQISDGTPLAPPQISDGTPLAPPG